MSEKLPLLVIGHCLNPHCFPEDHPVTYKSNKKAWMTSEEWLTILNKKMGEQHQRICTIASPSEDNGT